MSLTLGEITQLVDANHITFLKTRVLSDFFKFQNLNKLCLRFVEVHTAWTHEKTANLRPAFDVMTLNPRIFVITVELKRKPIMPMQSTEIEGQSGQMYKSLESLFTERPF